MKVTFTFCFCLFVLQTVLLLVFFFLLLLLLLPSPPQSFFCGFPFFSFPLQPLILKTIWRSLPLAWGGNLIPHPSTAVLCFDFCYAAPLLSLDPSRTSHERHVHAFLAVTCTCLSSLSRRDHIISLALFTLTRRHCSSCDSKTCTKKRYEKGGRRLKNILLLSLFFVCLFYFLFFFFFFFFKQKKKI